MIVINCQLISSLRTCDASEHLNNKKPGKSQRLQQHQHQHQHQLNNVNLNGEEKYTSTSTMESVR